MPKGRKPVPAKVKLFKASGRAKPRQPIASLPKPDSLDTEAGAEWDRLAPMLIEAGRLTEANVTLFVNLCNLKSIVASCRAAIESDGVTVSTATGGDKTHPAFGPMYQAQAEQRRLYILFGLADKNAKASREEDEFEAWNKQSG